MKPLLVSQKGQLLEALFVHLKGMTKTKVKQFLKHGSVRVNGRVVTSHRQTLQPGDTVDFLSKQGARAERLKEELDFPLIHEDESILVVDKPAGLLTMGTEDEKENTLYFMLTAFVRAKSSNHRGRVYIVHRLDRDASGLVIFAKSEKAKIALQGNWDKAVKKYYAVCEGFPVPAQGRYESYLVEDKFRRVYSVSANTYGAKHAITHYNTLAKNATHSLLEIGLTTGRKNQIRVHLSEAGHPIAGDSKYEAQTNPLGRLGLHSFRLSFEHPDTGKRVSFETAIPPVFEKLFKKR